MYQCFHCGAMAVCWDSDFDFSDYGFEGNGIIHVCHCSNCGAEIEYYIPIEDVLEDESEEESEETKETVDNSSEV